MSRCKLLEAILLRSEAYNLDVQPSPVIFHTTSRVGQIHIIVDFFIHICESNLLCYNIPQQPNHLQDNTSKQEFGLSVISTWTQTL
jgi:hypothetical protein